MALIVLSGCSKPTDGGKTFTLATGIQVVEVSDCHEGIAPKRLAIEKVGDAHVISGAVPTSCVAPLEAPYLTLTNEHRATLVLRQADGRSVFGSGCDCWRTIAIRIEGRLEPGDTLYVSNDGEVVGDFLTH